MVPNIGTVLLVLVLPSTVPSLAAPRNTPEATSTSTISYQGRLADSGGNPLTGYCNLEFRIYDVPSGGAPLWEEFWTGGNYETITTDGSGQANIQAYLAVLKPTHYWMECQGGGTFWMADCDVDYNASVGQLSNLPPNCKVVV